MNIIIFLIIILVLVVAHEFGHFIVAKKSGIRVDEFSFGFPPKLFGKKIGETTYNFNLLPLGGYVKIFGENPDAESINGPDKNRSFVNKPWYTQIAVLVAGVVMNFLVAWILLSVGFMSGLPSSVGSETKNGVIENAKLTITSIQTNSSAEKAGLKVGDTISSMSAESLIKGVIDTTETPTPESVQFFVKKHANDEIKVSFSRAKENKEVTLIPVLNEDTNTPMIGISMDMIGKLKLSFFDSLIEGFKLTVALVGQTFNGFYNLIADALKGNGSFSSMTGPVGIVGVVGDAREFGFIYLLSFTALISINLAVINLIPFPALDGGRILFILIEKIKGSRIKPEIANALNTGGFAVLMLLMLFITYKDIVKIFHS